MAGAGYFASRCKAPTPEVPVALCAMGWAWRAAENSRRTPLPGRAACRLDRPLKKAVSAALSDTEGKRPDGTDDKTGSAHARLPVPAVASERHEPCDVFRGELHPHGCPQRIDAEAAQILVEVVALGRQRDRLDPGRCARGRTVQPSRHRRPDRCRARHRAGAASPETGWRRDARPTARPPSAWSGMTQRSDSMVSMPSPAAITSRATPKRTALPRRWPIARRGVSIGALPSPVGSSQRSVSAMRAGDAAVEIGDGCDHRRPGLGRRMRDPGDSSSAGGNVGLRFRAKP